MECIQFSSIIHEITVLCVQRSIVSLVSGYAASMFVSSYQYLSLGFQAHPWFKGVNWDMLYEMEAAYKPIVTGELDTQNFEKFPEVSTFLDRIPDVFI